MAKKKKEKKEKKALEAKQVLITLHTVADGAIGIEDGTPMVHEWMVTIRPGELATHLGLDLIVPRTEENPNGRLTIVRVPFKGE